MIKVNKVILSNEKRCNFYILPKLCRRLYGVMALTTTSISIHLYIYLQQLYIINEEEKNNNRC